MLDLYNWQEYTAFFTVMGVMSVTPGPNNIMLLRSGLHFGFSRSLPHYFGILVGYLLIFVLLSFGLGTLFLEAVWLQITLKIIGACYLLYLAYRIFRMPPIGLEDEEMAPLSFRGALLFQFLNPKIFFSIITLISSYVHFEKGFWYALLPLLPAILVCLNGAACFWLLGGHFLKRYMQNPFHQKLINRVLGILLALLAVMILIPDNSPPAKSSLDLPSAAEAIRREK